MKFTVNTITITCEMTMDDIAHLTYALGNTGDHYELYKQFESLRSRLNNIMEE